MKMITSPLTLAPAVSTSTARSSAAVSGGSFIGGGAAHCGMTGSAMVTWAASVQGIAVSAPAHLLGDVTGVTTVAANAAKGANRKRTAGDEAFEDPV